MYILYLQGPGFQVLFYICTVAVADYDQYGYSIVAIYQNTTRNFIVNVENVFLFWKCRKSCSYIYSARFWPQIRNLLCQQNFSPNIQFKENGQTSTMDSVYRSKDIVCYIVTQLKRKANKTILTIFLYTALYIDPLMNTKTVSLSDFNYRSGIRNRKSTAKIDSASSPAYRYYGESADSPHYFLHRVPTECYLGTLFYARSKSW